MGGHQLDHRDQSCIVPDMKLLVALSAMAAVASSSVLLPGLGYAGFHGLGYAGLKSAPCVNAANVPVPCVGGYLHYGKREAEAEPYYGYAGLGYAGVGHAVVGTTAGLIHSSHVGLCTNAWGAAVPCLGKKKREAEAEAEAEPYVGLGYAGLGYAGLGYAGIGYAGLGYSGLGHHVAGYASVSPSASVSIAGAAPAAVPAIGGLYAGAGRYVANSAGIVHAA